MEHFPRPALNLVVVDFDGVVRRVWFNNPENRGGVWLVRADGSMHWCDNEVVHAMDSLGFSHPDAFPAVD